MNLPCVIKLYTKPLFMKFVKTPARLSIIFWAISLVFFAACNKDQSATLTPQEEEVASNAISEADAEADVIFDNVFDDVMGVSDEVGLQGTGVYGKVAIVNQNARIDSISPTLRCATLTITKPNPSAAFPVKIVVDFGTGCKGPDGRIRSGKIISEYTGRLITPGATAITIFKDYKIDSISIEGTHKITNTGSANTERKFKVEVSNAKLTKPNGNFAEWNSTKFINQIEGLTTPLYAKDDVFRIEGGAGGRVKKGNLIVGWKSEITDPLIKRFNCRWIVKGKVRIIRSNSNANSPWTALLDFGNGDCNNRAEITINGIIHEITLP
jgi:hypothetical protein